MRLIDADALEKEGWSLHRIYQKDKETMVYEVKAISEINTAQPEDKCGECKLAITRKTNFCPNCGRKVDWD